MCGPFRHGNLRLCMPGRPAVDQWRWTMTLGPSWAIYTLPAERVRRSGASQARTAHGADRTVRRHRHLAVRQIVLGQHRVGRARDARLAAGIARARGIGRVRATHPSGREFNRQQNEREPWHVSAVSAAAAPNIDQLAKVPGDCFLPLEERLLLDRLRGGDGRLLLPDLILHLTLLLAVTLLRFR